MDEILENLVNKIENVFGFGDMYYRNASLIIKTLSNSKNIEVCENLSENILFSEYGLSEALLRSIDEIKEIPAHFLSPGKIIGILIINLFFANIIQLKEHLKEDPRFLRINYYNALITSCAYITEISHHYMVNKIDSLINDVLDGFISKKSLGLYFDEVIKHESNNPQIKIFYGR